MASTRAMDDIRFTADRYDHLRLLAIATYAAYRNANVGNPAPAVKAYWDRATKVQPGDVVLETSTVWTWAKYAVNEPRPQYPELGVLLRITQEPMYPDADDEEDRDITETVYYIQPLDGSVPEYRWTNASFIRVPCSLADASGGRDDDRHDP